MMNKLFTLFLRKVNTMKQIYFLPVLIQSNGQIIKQLIASRIIHKIFFLLYYFTTLNHVQIAIHCAICNLQLPNTLT